MRVLHMLHPLEVRPSHFGSTVRRGFRWTDATGERIVLCVCSTHCTDPDLCGQTTWQEVMAKNPYRTSEGHPAYDDLWSCDSCQATGLGDVMCVWVGQFKDIPARLIDDEHELQSRQYSGLLASMRRAYGPEFSVSEFVTVLNYWRAE